MRRAAVLALVCLAGAGSSAATAAAPHHHTPRMRTQTKAQAELHVLSIVTRSWPTRRLLGLVNPRTHALATNTQAVCNGRGARVSGTRFSSFVCVIRPLAHRRHEGLYLSYRVLATGGARVHWITYRKR